MRNRIVAALLAALTVLAPASGVAQDGASRPLAATVQTHRIWRFEERGGAVEFDNDFGGARLNGCERVAPFEFKLVISPENEPINPSPWYAFRVSSEVERELTLRIVITASKSRPWPLESSDGVSFARVPSSRYSGGDGAKECTLRLTARTAPTWIASNHMVGLEELRGWSRRIAKQVGVEVRDFGSSTGGRAIEGFEFGAADARLGIVVIGRQHPPEATGSLGLMRFIETLGADTEIARAFRATHRVLCIPVVNPDGVHEGHWRSTLGAVDSNRDWGPFTQPETRAVREAIVSFAGHNGMKLRLLLDFHATAKDILYVPPDDTPLDPPHFARDWLARIAERFPDYLLESSATNNTKEWTFKRWAFETFGAPGITYELGSATPKASIERTVAGAAEEAMKLLVARETVHPVAPRVP